MALTTKTRMIIITSAKANTNDNIIQPINLHHSYKNQTGLMSSSNS